MKNKNCFSKWSMVAILDFGPSHLASQQSSRPYQYTNKYDGNQNFLSYRENEHCVLEGHMFAQNGHWRPYWISDHVHLAIR